MKILIQIVPKHIKQNTIFIGDFQIYYVLKCFYDVNIFENKAVLLEIIPKPKYLINRILHKNKKLSK